MAFIPNTDQDRKEMMERIGVKSFEELIEKIPEQVRLKEPLNLPEKLSEFEVTKLMQEYASKNVTTNTHTCFMGGGAYDRFTPSIVFHLIDRPEFKTAYTPYQAEVSQGTLQVMYEYQSMVCMLSGMDASNTSMYDAGSALAEAALMAAVQTKKKEILIAGTINPNYKRVMDTTCAGRDLEFKVIAGEDGACDVEMLRNAMSEKTAGIIVQNPNFYGTIEDVQEIEKIAHSQKCLFIVTADPVSLAVLEAPGNYGADIYVGEGQSLGVPLSYGGPYLGIFAVKKKLMRKMPGRIAGITQDLDGNRGFTLTLQTREQHISREKATSNICSNQGLIMLASTIYMETLGKQGLKEVAEQSMQKAHYLAKEITAIPGFEMANDKPFFNEFLLKTPVAAHEITQKAIEAGFLAGIDTAHFEGHLPGLLIAATEKRTKEEMDSFVEFLKQFAK